MTVEVQEPQEIKSHWWNLSAYQPWPRGEPGVQGDLDILRNHGAAVGIPPDTYPFPQMQRFLDRAQAWDRVTWEGWAAVQQQVQEARNRALNVEATEPGRNALAVQAVKELAKAERDAAGNLLYPSTLPIYQLFAKQAAGAIDRVRAVLPLPARIWAALEPDSVMPDDTSATLHTAERVFNTCHFVGRWLRAIGLQGADQFLGDEPPLALTFRRYAEASEHHHELRTIPKVLRLAYVVEHDWQPGLWTRDDMRGVDQGPALRRFVPAFLVR